jgi:hypothetical protein
MEAVMNNRRVMSGVILVAIFIASGSAADRSHSGGALAVPKTPMANAIIEEA